MKKALSVIALLSLLAMPALLSPTPSAAQEDQCFPPEFMVAKARAERPSTDILERHTGSEATALINAMNKLEGDVDQTPAADEITVLRSAQSDELMLLGAEEGCLVWRGQMSLSDYEHVTWKAFGLPI